MDDKSEREVRSMSANSYKLMISNGFMGVITLVLSLEIEMKIG